MQNKKRTYYRRIVRHRAGDLSAIATATRFYNISRTACPTASVKSFCADVTDYAALKRAFEATGNEGYDEYFAGPTAAAFGPESDPIAPCRILAEYAGKTPAHD